MCVDAPSVVARTQRNTEVVSARFGANIKQGLVGWRSVVYG